MKPIIDLNKEYGLYSMEEDPEVRIRSVRGGLSRKLV